MWYSESPKVSSCPFGYLHSEISNYSPGLKQDRQSQISGLSWDREEDGAKGLGHNFSWIFLGKSGPGNWVWELRH